MLDTSVAIALRDHDPATLDRIELLGEKLVLSVITHVELEGGVYSSAPLDKVARRAALDELLRTLPVIEFDEQSADTYGRILATTGFSRRKVLDRLIAAQALCEGATLITFNPADFRDVPGLSLLEW